jgi:hypothetical protein
MDKTGEPDTYVRAKQGKVLPPLPVLDDKKYVESDWIM